MGSRDQGPGVGPGAEPPQAPRFLFKNQNYNSKAPFFPQDFFHYYYIFLLSVMFFWERLSCTPIDFEALAGRPYAIQENIKSQQLAFVTQIKEQYNPSYILYHF